MEPNLFISIDFDGTVTNVDITDLIIKEFAQSEWQEAERLWEQGIIGSKECLAIQFSLIDVPIKNILEYVKNFTIDESFIEFIGFLKKFNIPFGIISDGFQVIIESLLLNAGLKDIPIYANQLIETDKGLKTIFPYADENCSSGVCKCKIAEKLSNRLPIIHIGDGRSDFCIAEKAEYIFSKGKLTEYCKTKNIPYCTFHSFKDIEKNIKILLKHSLITEGLHMYKEQIGEERRIWNFAT